MICSDKHKIIHVDIHMFTQTKEPTVRQFKKLYLDIHCPLMRKVSLQYQLLLLHLDGDDGASYAQAYEVVQGTQTCSAYVAQAFLTGHKALDQSRRSHDSVQNLNRSVCLDPKLAVCLEGRMHMDLLHKASSVLSPVL